MRLKCLPIFLSCILLLAAGCGNMGVSGQGSNRGGSSGGGNVSIPFFTSLNKSTVPNACNLKTNNAVSSIRAAFLPPMG